VGLDRRRDPEIVRCHVDWSLPVFESPEDIAHLNVIIAHLNVIAAGQARAQERSPIDKHECPGRQAPYQDTVRSRSHFHAVFIAGRCTKRSLDQPGSQRGFSTYIVPPPRVP